MARDCNLTIIFGRNGTGKSTFARQRIEQSGRRGLVVSYNNKHKIWQDLPKVWPHRKETLNYKTGLRHTTASKYESKTKTNRLEPNKNRVFEYIDKNFRNGVVLFDDCKEYTPNAVHLNIHLKSLLIDFRPNMVDIFFVAHSPLDVPKKAWQHASYVYAGATDSIMDSSYYRSTNARLIREAQERVNKLFKSRKRRGDKSHYGLFELVEL